VYNSTIIDIKKETEDTYRFFSEIEDVKNFDFKAGQFVSFMLPLDETKGRKGMRHYSIASSPAGNVLEFIINKVPGGKGTEYLFEETKIGTQFPIKGPLGKFLLPNNIKHDLCMVCTGTGIAPFRSMINQIYNTNISHKEIYLIFGTQKKEDLLYHQEMLALDKKHKSFHYKVALSREEYGGYRGYVHPLYQQIFDGKKQGHFFFCGMKNMIVEGRDWLLEKGYERKNIRYELYG
jgi:CDP-4-dehydro-6-deoxyglucose reductase